MRLARVAEPKKTAFSILILVPRQASNSVLLIGSPYVRKYLDRSAVGATRQNLNQSVLINLVVGLPPLAEQHRIVAKVDELMALCDRLEASLAIGEKTRCRLLEALLHEALSPRDRVAHLIEQESGVSYHPGHVWKILRQLGWSCQRPAGRALERDEKAIERWQKARWPELKKRPKIRAGS
jgi:winged helix-turn-helix protein/type I restriction modification DNA specificity protein